MPEASCNASSGHVIECKRCYILPSGAVASRELRLLTFLWPSLTLKAGSSQSSGQCHHIQHFVECVPRSSWVWCGTISIEQGELSSHHKYSPACGSAWWTGCISKIQRFHLIFCPPAAFSSESFGCTKVRSFSQSLHPSLPIHWHPRLWLTKTDTLLRSHWPFMAH